MYNVNSQGGEHPQTRGLGWGDSWVQPCILGMSSHEILKNDSRAQYCCSFIHEHIYILWNSKYFLGEWGYNPFKVGTRSSKKTIKLSSNTTSIPKFVQWAKQCTPTKNKTTFSFFCMVTLNFEPWNTPLPSRTINVGYFPNSSTPITLNVTKGLRIKLNMLSFFPCTSNFFTNQKWDPFPTINNI